MSKFANSIVANLEPYTPGEQPKNKKLIKLNTNENPYPPGPKVMEALSRDKSFQLYPDPSCKELIQAIASYYNLNSNQVTVGNGSDEILAFAYMAYGEKIYSPEISYGFYPVFSQVFDKKACYIKLNKNLEIDIEDYFNLDGTIIIANPNAPTGITLSLKEIEKLLKNNKDNVVIIDEAYIDFGGESSVKLIDKYENLLVVQTFSKSRSLAGMRIGFALGNSELIDDLNKIQFSFNPYNLSRDAIVAGAAAIDDITHFLGCRGKIISTREFFVEEMGKMGFTVLPSKANFVFAKTGKEYFQKLREKDILVRHFDKEPIKDFIRITIGTREEMESLLQAMEEIKCEKQK